MTEKTMYCSFCGKSQHDVRKLIAGPGTVSICDECVDLCREIVDAEPFVRSREDKKWAWEQGRQMAEAGGADFSRTPVFAGIALEWLTLPMKKPAEDAPNES